MPIVPRGLALAGSIAVVLVLGCSPRADEILDVETAPPESDETKLLRAAVAERSRPPEQLRLLVPPECVGGFREFPFDSDGAPAGIDSIVHRMVVPRIAPIAPAPADESRKEPSSRSLVRAYVYGRDALVREDFQRAIVELEQAVRAGGGPSAVRLLASALDGAGRDVDALAIRREMARQGWLDRFSRGLLLDGLRRRELIDEAIAVAASGALSGADEWERLQSAIDLVVILQAADREDEARALREFLLREDLDGLVRRGLVDGRRVAGIWRIAGDDAARDRRIAIADERWRRGRAIDPTADDWGDRLAWAAACLGRDAIVAELVLAGARRPGSVSVDFIRRLREGGVDLDPVARILAEELEREPTRAHTARVLAACDPARASRVFATLADREVEAAIAGPLVAAAIPAGVEATWNAATPLGKEPEILDVVVDQLLSGPWTSDELLSLVLAPTLSSSVASLDPAAVAVTAETLRRHSLANPALALLRDGGTSTTAGRVVEIRIHSDLMDPLGVDGVDRMPFDARVEEARVLGLLETGEPELALERIDEALLRAPDDFRLTAARGRVLARFRGRTQDALAAMGEAWRQGDRRMTTRLEIVALLGRLDQAGGRESDRSFPWRGELMLDPSLRRLLEADQALSLGDASEAERLIMPLIEAPEWRDVAIPRLLSAWRASGRLAVGRSIMERMRAERPSDPVLGDAVFALERVLEGPRALAARMRTAVASGASGRIARHFEMVLAEIPESRSEWRRVMARRLDDSPVTAVNRLARVEISLGADPGERAILRETLAAFDIDRLTPRLRRRLATVASTLPDDAGRETVSRVLRRHREGGLPIDVDTVVAAIRSLGADRAIRSIEGLAAISPITLQDPTWTSRLLAPDVLEGLGVEASAAGLEFAIDALEPGSSPVRTPRAAVATALAAGGTSVAVLDLILRARDRGWDLAAGWELPAGERPVGWIPFMEIASDASLLGREEVSIQLLQETLARNPDDSIAMNNLGYALLEADRIAEAAPLIERSFELDPLNPSTLDSLGWLRYLQGRNDPADPDGALPFIERSIRIRQFEGRGIPSEVLMHRGDAAWRAGRRSAAVADWSAIREAASGRSDQARRAALDAYQRDAWGGVLIDSGRIDRQLEGRWLEMAEARLSALERDEPPPVTPLPAEVERGVQERGN